MRIRNRSYVVLGYIRCGISVHRGLFPSIGIERISCIVLRKVVGFICPVIFVIENNRITAVLVITLQLYSNTCRTDTILVIVIDPCLLDCCRSCLCGRVIGICDRGLAGFYRVRFLIVVRNNLFPLILDLLSILKYRKILFGCLPVVACIQNYVLSCNSVYLQLYSDGCRLVRGRIHLVVPDLLNRQRCLCDLVSIRDRCNIACFSIRSSISIYSGLFPGVGVFIVTAVILLKILFCMSPSVAGVQDYRITAGFAVTFELNGDTCRTDTVTVIVINPVLLNGRRDFLNSHVVSICDRSCCAAYCIFCSIVVNSCFFPLILDRNAVLVYRKISFRCLPLIIGTQDLRSNSLAICIQFYLNRCRY